MRKVWLNHFNIDESILDHVIIQKSGIGDIVPALWVQGI